MAVLLSEEADDSADESAGWLFAEQPAKNRALPNKRARTLFCEAYFVVFNILLTLFGLLCRRRESGSGCRNGKNRTAIKNRSMILIYSLYLFPTSFIDLYLEGHDLYACLILE